MDVIEIPLPDGTTAEAFLTRPDGVAPDASTPGVLFIMDAIGLRPQIAQMMERISGWGYTVLAPNVFHRSGSIADCAPTADLRLPGERENFFGTVMPRMQALTPDLARADVGAYTDFLAAMDGVDGDKIGVTGYCLGSRLALIAACERPNLVAAVGGWHGARLVTDDADSPHLGLPQATATFSFGHAQDDPSMPAEAIETLTEALTAAGRTFVNEALPGPHGFTMADTSMYGAQADAMHWERLEALLREQLPVAD